jgi:hypothetical protein
MTVYVFTGPTISAAEARRALDAVYLPPVAQGDVYRIALLRPRAIGIIDGYFECVPAVWHKEILWALTRGIHIYGSASMGALRAAELAPFGMRGVGDIYRAYRDGLLEDDDEVAVTHGPEDADFRTLSEAMVNIRRTLASAEADAVVGANTRAALERIAKDLFFPDRSYPLMLRLGAAHGLPERELDALRRWLPQGRINQKREDALAMLREMRRGLAEEPPPGRVSFTFEHTYHWDRAMKAAARGPRPRGREPEARARRTPSVPKTRGRADRRRPQSEHPRPGERDPGPTSSPLLGGRREPHRRAAPPTCSTNERRCHGSDEG